MKRYAATLALILALSACSAPNRRPEPRTVPTPAPAAPATPAPLPAEAPALTKTDDRLVIAPVKNGAYGWSDDGKLLAFETEDGLWTISPEEGTIAQVAEGKADRTILGWNGDNVIYRERRPGEGEVVHGGTSRPGLRDRRPDPDRPLKASAPFRDGSFLYVSGAANARSLYWKGPDHEPVALAGELAGDPLWRATETHVAAISVPDRQSPQLIIQPIPEQH